MGCVDRWLNKIILGDCLDVMREMPDKCVHCIVTSPPYWGLRDYGVEGQLGLEKSPEEYISKMVELFHEARRVLRDDGTLWLNLGDSYAANRTYQVTDNKYVDVGNNKSSTVPSGLKTKDLIGIPWRVAFALQSDSWYLRSDIIWHKPNPMPESVTDRPTKSHEYIFLMSKSEKYYYDNESIKEEGKPKSIARYEYAFGGAKNEHLKATDKPTAIVGMRTFGKWSNEPLQSSVRRMNENTKRARVNGEYTNDNPFGLKRNKRTVWTINTQPFPEAHFATFPPDLIKPCILAGCPEGGVVLDPFMGAGTTAVVCSNTGRNYIGIELNPEYVTIASERIEQATRQERLFV